MVRIDPAEGMEERQAHGRVADAVAQHQQRDARTFFHSLSGEKQDCGAINRLTDATCGVAHAIWSSHNSTSHRLKGVHDDVADLKRGFRSLVNAFSTGKGAISIGRLTRV